MKNAMFHVIRRGKIAVLAAFFAFCLATFLSSPLHAEVSDLEMARHIASLLGEKFSPESVTVTVRESRAYAEMKGAVLSRIRIDTMRLDALLTNRDQPLSDDVDSLASLIGYSRGELVLLERDVNAYFDDNDTRGFSNLVFDFKPEGFRADGVFSATFLFTLRIRLAATGVLGLGSDGVYLENVKIYTESIKQPDMLTNQVLSRVNPLIEWSDIPFKVEFKEIAMDDEAARMTGDPQPLEGATHVWRPR
ncbi:DUF2993 domain-containing protein [Synergistaceae bacterium OttesenSCG-928-I11]|nr:DUF2993 domain-containing protein [Synergistaceae bacterium OttesenSCG-928-I11]